MGYNCLFTDTSVTVFIRSGDSVAFKGVLEGQLYLVDFDRAELDTKKQKRLRCKNTSKVSGESQARNQATKDMAIMSFP